MVIPKLQPSPRKREYDQCTEFIRDKIVYYYLFEGRPHRWLDENIVGQDSSYSRGYISMGVLHYLGLVDVHKNIFNEIELHEAIENLEESNSSDFTEIIKCLTRIKYNDYSDDRFASFIPSPESPVIEKNVGTSQYTDGVRIEIEYHHILNPKNSTFYVTRGSARKIKVLFNNRVYDAEYRHEGQTDKSRQLQSIRFRKELKAEFKKVFPEPVGKFTIQLCIDLNHFVFNHKPAEAYYPDEDIDYPEGKVAYRKHKIRERNSKVVNQAKKLFKDRNQGRLYCEVCGFDFTQCYGSRGEGFIEGHHIKPVSEMLEGENTKVSDIVMICPNCHRMIHNKPKITVEELKELVEQLSNLKK